MSRPPLEVADVFRLYGAEYRRDHPGLPTVQHRAMRAIERCRTDALGGHLQQCNHCGHRVISYNSCRNRNCPKCQCSAAKRWVAQRHNEILPIPYFHLVFTVPKEIAQIALGNQKVLYSILFRSVARTLLQVSQNHFSAEIGFLAILHTWGQNLNYHPHIHCIVTGGAWNDNQQRWIAGRKKFFLPIAVLSKVFRGKFLASLRAVYAIGKLNFSGKLSHLNTRRCLNDFLNPVAKTSWVVYCKPPFGGPSQVLKYLGRYTHRIAISNSRLINSSNGSVTFRWKDYRDQSKSKIMTLPAHEFIRRFLMHVLPSRFVRIRYYGFLSNCKRGSSLENIRSFLSNLKACQIFSTPTPSCLHHSESFLCPKCKQGCMITVQLLPPVEFDSS
jgi:Putative transposase/Transposase zinc-binding domain